MFFTGNSETPSCEPETVQCVILQIPVLPTRLRMTKNKVFQHDLYIHMISGLVKSDC